MSEEKKAPAEKKPRKKTAKKKRGGTPGKYALAFWQRGTLNAGYLIASLCATPGQVDLTQVQWTSPNGKIENTVHIVEAANAAALRDYLLQFITSNDPYLKRRSLQGLDFLDRNTPQS